MPDPGANIRRRHWWRGILLQIVACVLYLIALVIAAFAQLFRDPSARKTFLVELNSGNETVSLFVVIALVCVCTAFGYYGMKLFLYGRQLKVSLVPNPSALKTPFVLYLRPFETQSVTSRRHNPYISLGILANMFLEIFHSTEEQKLAKALGVIAPGITVGRPDDEVPPLGFRRLYIEEEDWTSTVRELIVKARLVVLRLGGAPGILWELKTAKELIPPEQLLLLVPSESSLVIKRSNLQSLDLSTKEKLDAESGMKLPRVEHTLSSLETVSIAGFIYFEAGWNAHAVPLETGPSYFQSDLIAALEPVLKQIGVRRTLSNRLRHSLWFKLALVLAFWVLVLRFNQC
jgi:hypothetical protein